MKKACLHFCCHQCDCYRGTVRASAETSDKHGDRIKRGGHHDWHHHDRGS